MAHNPTKLLKKGLNLLMGNNEIEVLHKSNKRVNKIFFNLLLDNIVYFVFSHS